MPVPEGSTPSESGDHMAFTSCRFWVTRVRRTYTYVPPSEEVEVDELGNEVEPDELGNETVTVVEDDVQVAGWAVPRSAEPKLAGHDRRTVEVELFAPVGMFRPTDGVRLPEREDVLEVIGEPENYEHNPFGWAPGLEVVNLGGTQ